jgi:transposase
VQGQLRRRLINNDNYREKDEWILDFHYDLRDEAMRTFLHNRFTNLAKKKKFNLRSKNRRDRFSISVLAKHWNKNNWFREIFNPEKMKSSEPLPERLEYTSRLIKTELNQYYLSIPEPLEANVLGEDERSMVFIDPGVKNFWTGYDPFNEKIVTWGKGDIGRIARLLHHSKKLQGKISKCKDNRKKTRMGAAGALRTYGARTANLRMTKKIHDLTDDMHKKSVLWLVKNYEQIYIPRLNFHDFRNLNRASKKKTHRRCVRGRRPLASLRHCSFVDRLIDKTREHSKTKVFQVTEQFTSKTCTNCGAIDEKLGNKDIYACSRCEVVIERDVTGARNIMLKYLTEHLTDALLPQPWDAITTTPTAPVVTSHAKITLHS